MPSPEQRGKAPVHSAALCCAAKHKHHVMRVCVHHPQGLSVQLKQPNLLPHISAHNMQGRVEHHLHTSRLVHKQKNQVSQEAKCTFQLQPTLDLIFSNMCASVCVCVCVWCGGGGQASTTTSEVNRTCFNLINSKTFTHERLDEWNRVSDLLLERCFHFSAHFAYTLSLILATIVLEFP